MKYLLDTDTCVYWLRRQSPVHRHLLAVDPADRAISIITLAELHHGAASARPTANKQAIDTFAQAIKILDLAPAVVLAFGDIKAHLRKTGSDDSRFRSPHRDDSAHAQPVSGDEQSATFSADTRSTSCELAGRVARARGGG